MGLNVSPSFQPVLDFSNDQLLASNFIYDGWLSGDADERGG